MTKTTILLPLKDKQSKTSLKKGDLVSFNSIRSYSLIAGVKREFLSEINGVILKVHNYSGKPYLIVFPLDLKGLVSINACDVKLLNKKRNG